MQGTVPVHAGEEGHARPGWTTSRRGQDSPWKSQSERQRAGINGKSTGTSMVWPRERGRNLFAKYVTKQKINNENSTMAGYQKRR